MNEAASSASRAPTTVLVRATRDEAPGAVLEVAGLRVFDRLLRQLGRAPNIDVIVASDGTIRLPEALPRNVQVQMIAPGDTQALSALTAGLGSPPTIGADVVRRQGDSLKDGVRVTDEPTRKAVEDAVFGDLLRGDLGVVARHINKKISFRITRNVLCKLPVTPNQVTVAAALIGFLGCLLIARGGYLHMLAGFLLMQVQSILDGCDGELARVRFQQSAIGEWLDTIFDDFLNLAMVAALGVGLARSGAGPLQTVTAALTVSMFLFYNVVSYRELLRQGVGGELLKIQWKLMRGRDFKSMWKNDEVSPKRLLLSLGRRDMFVFAWLILAALHLASAIVVWAFVIALSCFVTAVGQIFARDE